MKSWKPLVLMFWVRKPFCLERRLERLGENVLFSSKEAAVKNKFSPPDT
jgi:hypothetical protein